MFPLFDFIKCSIVERWVFLSHVKDGVFLGFFLRLEGWVLAIDLEVNTTSGGMGFGY